MPGTLQGLAFDAAPWLLLAAFTALCLWVDLRPLARDREPTWREAVAWSIGWLVLSLLAGPRARLQRRWRLPWRRL